MNLYGKMIEVSKLSEGNIQDMYQLMDTYYEHMKYSSFIRDLSEKDYCILLFDEEGSIKGFSTQKLLAIPLNGREIHGVFSGDTIIDKDHWGSLELYKVFAQNFIQREQHREFYWFLISKGYKTYKMLPLFFKSFYPNYRESTPVYEKQIMDAFGQFKYPGEYNPETGVVEYHGQKDKLREHVADITEKQLRDKDIRFFIEANPGHAIGNDLVCLARLEADNLRPTARRLFLSESTVTGHAGDLLSNGPYTGRRDSG